MKSLSRNVSLSLLITFQSLPKNKNITILKRLIKEEKAPHLDHVATSDLDLWRVSFPSDDLEMELGNINLAGYLKLSPPNKKLTTFFTNVADDCFHVIAKVPVEIEQVIVGRVSLGACSDHIHVVARPPGQGEYDIDSALMLLIIPSRHTLS